MSKKTRECVHRRAGAELDERKALDAPPREAHPPQFKRHALFMALLDFGFLLRNPNFPAFSTIF